MFVLITNKLMEEFRVWLIFVLEFLLNTSTQTVEGLLLYRNLCSLHYQFDWEIEASKLSLKNLLDFKRKYERSIAGLNKQFFQ